MGQKLHKGDKNSPEGSKTPQMGKKRQVGVKNAADIIKNTPEGLINVLQKGQKRPRRIKKRQVGVKNTAE